MGEKEIILATITELGIDLVCFIDKDGHFGIGPREIDEDTIFLTKKQATRLAKFIIKNI